MEWRYNGILLIDHLNNIIKDKKQLKYVYATIRRILKKEYEKNPKANIDDLINDILNMDKIKNIINSSYIKKVEKITWIYREVPLKEYIKQNIISPKKNQEQIYLKIKNEAIKISSEQNKNLIDNMDEIITSVLNSDNFKKYLNMDKKEDTKWYFKNIPLIKYISLNFDSSFRTKKQIRQNIEDEVTKQLKKDNLDNSYREEYIDNYINSSKFKKFLKTNPNEKLQYYYKNKKLYHYLEESVVDKNNLQYIYHLIVSKIRKIYNEQSNISLNEIVKNVVDSNEIEKLINSTSIEKLNKEIWPYKNGLLIDYIRSIDLNGKDPQIVYLQVKQYINNNYPSGFLTIEDKEQAISKYINSIYFKNYLKYGYTNRTVYFYKNMLFVDYLKLNYKEQLEQNNKSVDNLYHHALYWISNNFDISTSSINEIEYFIDIYLNSDDFKIYINSPKKYYQDWSFNNVNLKDKITQLYSDIIEEENDIYNIYSSIIFNAHKIKNKYPEMNNNEIISKFFTKEYISEYSSKFIKKREIKKEVDKKTLLWNNKDDINYITIYALENKLDVCDILEISSKGFNYYSSIILIEYSIKYEYDLNKLLEETIEILKKEQLTDNEALWLFKLGYKSYIYEVIKKNKKRINNYIFKYKRKTGLNIYTDFDDIYSFLTMLLITKHISITVSKDYLMNSFMSFVSNSIERYFLTLRRKSIEYSLDYDNGYNRIKNLNNNENNYLKKEEREILLNAINELNEIEKEFVLLRYGFINYPHNIEQIKNILNKKGIYITENELIKMDKDIINKLKENPKILSLNK